MLYLASFLDQPVRGKTDELIGRLEDLIVRVGDESYPPISGLVVRDGRRNFFVPATQLESLNGVTRLVSSTVNLRPFRRRDGEILLRKDVLDHQIIDITGRRVVRVNDVQVARVDAFYRLVGVDISPQALLRRLGPRSLAGSITGRRVIDWQDAQYLASEAPVRLRVSYDRLSQIHPVDLARIVDSLSYRESAEIVAALDDETAAELLEEVSEERLTDLLEGMDRGRAADILEEMSPGSAADALEDLDEVLAEEILASMDPEDAADVQQQLAYAEGTAGRIMRTDFVRIVAGATVADALTLLRGLVDPPDPLLAVYVVSAQPVSEVVEPSIPLEEQPIVLRGIVRLRSLVTASPETPLAELMDANLPTVHPAEDAEHVARVLAEYNLLAVPVLDNDGRMLGTVTVDDALAEILPEIWRNRSARLFG